MIPKDTLNTMPETTGVPDADRMFRDTKRPPPPFPAMPSAPRRASRAAPNDDDHDHEVGSCPCDNRRSVAHEPRSVAAARKTPPSAPPSAQMPDTPPRPPPPPPPPAAPPPPPSVAALRRRQGLRPLSNA